MDKMEVGNIARSMQISQHIDVRLGAINGQRSIQALIGPVTTTAMDTVVFCITFTYNPSPI